MKLNNIVFARPNSREIRVVDFGISGLYATNNPEKSLAGSLKYMAPEILTGKNTAADPAIDIFSIGVILFALVVGKLPFDGKDTVSIRNKIIKGQFVFPPGLGLSPECKDLIEKMMSVDPVSRIKMKAIFKHPWIEAYTKKMTPLLRQYTEYSSNSSSHSLSSGV